MTFERATNTTQNINNEGVFNRVSAHSTQHYSQTVTIVNAKSCLPCKYGRKLYQVHPDPRSVSAVFQIVYKNPFPSA